LDYAHRPYKVHKNKLSAGTDLAHTEALFSEPDEKFWVGISKPLSGEILKIGSSSKLTCEYHYSYANEPEAPFKVILPRKQDLEYYVRNY
jgi:oligopeptidase B